MFRQGQANDSPAEVRPSFSQKVTQSFFNKPFIWGVVILLVLMIAYRILSGGEAAQQGHGAHGANGAAMPVVTADARLGDMPIYFTGLGTVTPLATVTVHTRVDGQIETVGFTEGQLVHADDLLVQLDPRPFQVQLTQAEGNYAKDVALLKNAQLDLERDQIAVSAISRQQLDTQKALVAQYEGAVKSDQGVIDNAQLQLVYSKVTSPITGRIGLRLVDLGNIVHATDTTGIAVITQLQPITVIFSLPQDDLPQIMKAISSGAAPSVEAYDRDNLTKLAAGKFLAIDNQVDPTSGTVKLKAQFPNEDNALFPNQFVNARILVETRSNVVIAPLASVQRGPDSTFVYAVNKEQQTVDVRNVKVGPSTGNDVIINSGLQPGETVVTDGVDKLQQGAKVTFRQPGDNPAKAAPGASK